SIDHGRLLSTLLKGQRIGSNLVIAGSRPPPNDSLWIGFEIKVMM
ncbi:4254_t:CDS:1, partial [Paraglomus brasilianum]